MRTKYAVKHSTLFFLLGFGGYVPNVLQPYWFIVLPLDVPDLTSSLLLWGPSGQRWRCLWTFLFSNVPTFATGRLQDSPAAKGGTTCARNDEFCLKMPDFHVTFIYINLRHGTYGFTSPPKEGVLRIFSLWKSNGFGRVWTRELGYQRPAHNQV